MSRAEALRTALYPAWPDDLLPQVHQGAWPSVIASVHQRCQGALIRFDEVLSQVVANEAPELLDFYPAELLDRVQTVAYEPCVPDDFPEGYLSVFFLFSINPILSDKAYFAWYGAMSSFGRSDKIRRYKRTELFWRFNPAAAGTLVAMPSQRSISTSGELNAMALTLGLLKAQLWQNLGIRRIFSRIDLPGDMLSPGAIFVAVVEWAQATLLDLGFPEASEALSRVLEGNPNVADLDGLLARERNWSALVKNLQSLSGDDLTDKIVRTHLENIVNIFLDIAGADEFLDQVTLLMRLIRSLESRLGAPHDSYLLDAVL